MVYANKVIQLLFTFKETNLKLILSLCFTRHPLAVFSPQSHLRSARITIDVFSLATRPDARSLTKGQGH